MRLNGGIGRHNGLKIRCSMEREGSSPSDGTKKDKKVLDKTPYFWDNIVQGVKNESS